MFTDCFDVPEAGEALCLCGCCGCVADRGASEIGLLCDGSFQIIMPLARHVCGTRGRRQVVKSCRAARGKKPEKISLLLNRQHNHAQFSCTQDLPKAFDHYFDNCPDNNYVEETNMTRISSLAVDYYHAAKKKKMRTAAISGLIVVVVVLCLALLNESGDGVGISAGGDANVAAGQPTSVSTASSISDTTGDVRGATIRTDKAEDFDPEAVGEDNKGGEYPDGVVAEDDQERQHGDDYTDDVAGGLMEGGGDDDEFLLDSPDGPPTDDMMDDAAAEEV